MAKAYWVSCYRAISNPDALAAYAKLAGPALAPFGAKTLARGVPAEAVKLAERRLIDINAAWEDIQRKMAA